MCGAACVAEWLVELLELLLELLAAGVDRLLNLMPELSEEGWLLLVVGVGLGRDPGVVGVAVRGS
jgi:hypothetical protein